MEISHRNEGRKVNHRTTLQLTIIQFTFPTFSIVLPFPRRLIRWRNVANSWHCCFLSFPFFLIMLCNKSEVKAISPWFASFLPQQNDDNFLLFAQQQTTAEEEAKSFFAFARATCGENQFSCAVFTQWNPSSTLLLCLFTYEKGIFHVPLHFILTKERKTRVCFLYVITLTDTWNVVFVFVVRRRNVDRKEFSFLPADFTIRQWSERNFVSNFITCCVYFFGWKNFRHTYKQRAKVDKN